MYIYICVIYTYPLEKVTYNGVQTDVDSLVAGLQLYVPIQ